MSYPPPTTHVASQPAVAEWPTDFVTFLVDRPLFGVCGLAVTTARLCTAVLRTAELLLQAARLFDLGVEP